MQIRSAPDWYFGGAQLRHKTERPRWRKLLPRAPQVHNLCRAERFRRVIDGKSPRLESRAAGCERYAESATAAGNQSNRAIVSLRVVALHRYLADEGHRLRGRQVRVVEERNRQRGARRALLLVAKIQARAGRHSQWAGWIRFQLHRKTSAIDFAAGSYRAGTLDRVQFEKIIQAAIHVGVRLRHIGNLQAARGLGSEHSSRAGVRGDLEVRQQSAGIAVAVV